MVVPGAQCSHISHVSQWNTPLSWQHSQENINYVIKLRKWIWKAENPSCCHSCIFRSTCQNTWQHSRPKVSLALERNKNYFKKTGVFRKASVKMQGREGAWAEHRWSIQTFHDRTGGWSEQSLQIIKNLLENRVKWLKADTTGRTLLSNPLLMHSLPPLFHKDQIR